MKMRFCLGQSSARGRARGGFRRPLEPVLAAALTLMAVGAAEGDGIPEPSLVMYGVISNTAAGGSRVDPFADPDHDGLNNYQEYRAGTNPLDANSRFEIVRVRPDPAGAYVEWSSVAGHFYTVQRSATLLGGFSDLQNHVPATAPLNTFQDLTGAGGGPYFYRIQVE